MLIKKKNLWKNPSEWQKQLQWFVSCYFNNVLQQLLYTLFSLGHQRKPIYFTVEIKIYTRYTKTSKKLTTEPNNLRERLSGFLVFFTESIIFQQAHTKYILHVQFWWKRSKNPQIPPTQRTCFTKPLIFLIWGKIKTNFIFLPTKGASPWHKQTTPSIKWSAGLCFHYSLLLEVSYVPGKDHFLVNIHVAYAFLFKLPSWESNTKEVLLHLSNYSQVQIKAK